jgi:high affinity Mn2+ porin
MVPRHAIFRLSSEERPLRPRPWLLLLAAALCLAAKASAQDATAPNTPASDAPTSEDPGTAVTLFDHSSTTRWWLSGQMNFIGQGHGSFPAEYSGPNSLKNTPEFAVSQLLTLYTGYELTPDLEGLVDIEIAAGHGISNALGIAGFTNLDVVRNPDLSKAPYLARGMLRYTIPLSDEKVEAERSWLDLRTEVPARRIEIIVGKFSMPDFFDLNDVGTDSHLQFMNWCDDQNGAWDYAANTRGYTDGAIVQYIAPGWAVRYGLALMPKVANGIYLDADIARARGENLEFELHPALFRHRSSTVRLLSYVNHANMGSYRAAIDEFREGLVSVPDITAVRQQGRVKYGFGVNLEQDLPHNFRGFARWGWSDGHNESFAYTEVDRTGELGLDLSGNAWKRPFDKLGAAGIVNGLSGDHREYLALGGLGFLLGDGRLNYGTERIFETYYTAHLWRGFFGAIDVQHVTDPGYNRDRGPVWAPSIRLHIDY